MQRITLEFVDGTSATFDNVEDYEVEEVEDPISDEEIEEEIENENEVEDEESK
jgi:hypothetical protein